MFGASRICIFAFLAVCHKPINLHLPPMKTTLEIPDALYRQAKVQAAQENCKMKDLVSEGLRLVLAVMKKSDHGICAA